MEGQSLLAIFAHPDDEAFSVGGTVPWYTARGVNATLVCATRGEVGEISDPALATPETLGQVREAELDCAAQTMGVRQLVFLDYRDSGMAGSPENHDPRALINAPTADVVTRLVRIIRQKRPEVVITFGPDGIYGHPDHIAIHYDTLAAFDAAGDAAQYPDLGAPWLPARLFYTAMACSMLQLLREYVLSVGGDTHDVDQLEQAGGCPDQGIQVALDVSATIEAKWQALNCHRTQFGPDNLFRRVPEDVAKRAISREHFRLARPEPAPGLRLPDLFA